MHYVQCVHGYLGCLTEGKLYEVIGYVDGGIAPMYWIRDDRGIRSEWYAERFRDHPGPSQVEAEPKKPTITLELPYDVALAIMEAIRKASANGDPAFEKLYYDFLGPAFTKEPR